MPPEPLIRFPDLGHGRSSCRYTAEALRLADTAVQADLRARASRRLSSLRYTLESRRDAHELGDRIWGTMTFYVRGLMVVAHFDAAFIGRS